MLILPAKLVQHSDKNFIDGIHSKKHLKASAEGININELNFVASLFNLVNYHQLYILYIVGYKYIQLYLHTCSTLT